MTMATPDPTRPARVVVLGRRGFVASHLVRYLKSLGLMVTAIGKDEIDLALPESVAALGARLNDTDTVVITSTLTPDKGRDVRTLMTNLTMAQHLCEVFDKQPCAHVVHLSSDAVYTADRTGLDESSSREPADLYAVMHTAREMMLGSVLAARQVPYGVFRPVNIYGFGDSHNSYGPNRFIRQAFAESKISLFGNGEEQRCHLYIDDAIGVIAASIARRIAGRFNLAPPQPVTFLEVAEMIQAACPFPVEIERKPRSPSAVVTHRTYAVARLQEAFPEVRFTPMPVAIARYVGLIQEAGRSQPAAGQVRP